MHYSPLRYPGGKNKLSAFVAKICMGNNINEQYVEPYAGGASVALFLLLEGFVSRITINDKDKSIYAFWYSVLNHTEKLCKLISDTDISIDTWQKHKSIQKNKNNSDLLELGFSTFFLNRTNYSGIINGGVMGGKAQNGNYKIDCRFNKVNLIDRITRIASRKNDITVYKKDAICLINEIQNAEDTENVLIYFDPPYYLKSSTLYMNHYNDEGHKDISNKIKNIKNVKWIVSYDNVPEIQLLYSDYLQKEFTFKHTAYKSRVGKEVMFFSNNLKLPNIENWNPLHFKYVSNSIYYLAK